MCLSQLRDEILSWTGTNVLIFYFIHKPYDFHRLRMFYALTCREGFTSFQLPELKMQQNHPQPTKGYACLLSL